MSNVKNFEISALITGSLALVVGLAWNNAVVALIDEYIPQKYANSKNAWIKLLYAIMLTLVVAYLSQKIIGPS